MTQSIAPIRAGTLARPLPGKEVGERNLTYMARLAAMLPAPTEDVIDDLAGKILDSGSMYEENELWEAQGSKDLAGRHYIFHSVSMQPTDFEGGLPFFLVCSVTDCETGEKKVITTGSVNICASLIRAQICDELPWEAIIEAPRRPTKSGNVPLHLRWVAKIVTDDQGQEES